MKHTLIILFFSFFTCISVCSAKSSTSEPVKQITLQQDYSFNYPKPPEICDNGIDDDEDGFIDNFDADCPCENGAYNASCEEVCSYTQKDSFSFDIKLLWESDALASLNAPAFHDLVAGDIENDGKIEIVTSYYKKENDILTSGIRILNGIDGSMKFEFPLFIDSSNYKTIKPSIADIDQDGFAEIFTIDEFTVFCYSHDGNLKWKSDSLSHKKSKNVQFADFNQDGQSEVYIGTSILNGLTGKILFDVGLGNQLGTSFNRVISIAADVLDDEGLELVFSNQVSSLIFNNLTDSVGNKVINTVAPFTSYHGLSIVGDVNGDEKLDIITNNYTIFSTIYIWDPRLNEIISEISCPSVNCGMPFLGDFNGDCHVDLGLTAPAFFTFENDGLGNFSSLVSSPNLFSDDLVAVFDFNLDNKDEIVRPIRYTLDILDGETEEVLGTATTKNINGFYKSTVLVDANLDGSVNILVLNGLSQKVQCYGYAKTPFPPARSVWNQKGYHITNVNDDLTIPQFQQSSTLALEGYENCDNDVCPTPYNSFFAQATTRTQQGCFVWNASDFSINLLNYECIDDSLQFTIELSRMDNIKPLDCIEFSAYFDGISSDHFYQSYSWCDSLLTGYLLDTVIVNIPASDITFDQIYWVVNDSGHGEQPGEFIPGHPLECDYNNNIDSLDHQGFAFGLNLGDKIEKCETDQFTIEPGDGFISYAWSDGSSEPTLTVTDPGWYALTVLNQCDQIISDSVFIENHEAIVFDFGENIDLCPDQNFDFTFDESFDSIQVFVNNQLYCTNCNQISIPVDELSSITAIVGSSVCFAKDSLWVQPKKEEIITENIILCEGDIAVFHDSIISNPGNFLIPINNCDSLLDLHVQLEKLDTIANSSFHCEGDIVTIDGISYSSDTSVFTRIQHDFVCDTILYKSLFFQAQGTIFETHTICSGDSIMIYDNWYDSKGVFDSFIAIDNACDSILQVEISFFETQHSSEDLEICFADSILIGDIYFKNDTSVTETFTSQHGCDSFHISNISVRARFSSIDTFTLCAGDTLTWDSENITDQGLYFELIDDGEICDSVYQFYLDFHDTLEAPLVDLDCEERQYLLSFPQADNWQINWSNGQQGASIQTMSGDNLSVSAVSSEGCESAYQVDLPELTEFVEWGVPKEIDIEENDSFFLDLGIDSSQWIIQWSPVDMVDCEDCASVYLYGIKSSKVDVFLEHESGCVENFSILVRVKEPTIYFPNIFTPNGDGINERWKMAHSDESILSIQCSIYDRWGNLVFNNQGNQESEWDGFLNGEPVQAGIYMYLAQITKQDGSVENVTGSIMVSR